MKKFFIYSLMGVLMLTLITGCSEKSNGVKNLPIVSEASEVLKEESGDEEKILEPNSLVGWEEVLLDEFFLPDKNYQVKFYIKQDLITGTNYEYKLFNNQTEITFDERLSIYDDFINNEHLFCLNDGRVIIGGRWLVDLENIKLEHVIAAEEDFSVLSFAYSPDQEYLALCVKGEYSDKYGFNIYIINLENLSSKKIFFFESARCWTSGISFSLTWSDEKLLYFDGNLNESPTIFKYSLETDKVEPYLTKAWAPKISPEGKYMLYIPLSNYYEKDNNDLIIRDMLQQKELKIPHIGLRTWLNENLLLIYFSEKTALYKINEDFSYKIMQDINENNFVYISHEDLGQSIKLKYYIWKDGCPIIEETNIIVGQK